MNKIKLALLSTALISLNSFSALAEDKATTKKPVFDVNEVTVVATRSPQNVFNVPVQATVVDGGEPSIAGSSRVSEFLKEVPGLKISGGPRRNGEEFTLRGYDSQGIIIMVDGKKQNYNSAHDGRFFLDPSLLKKAEVVRGASSASYGPGGLGGVIAFETKDAIDFAEDGETEGVEVSVGYQSANDEFLTSATGYTLGSNYDAIVNISRRQSSDIELGDGSELESDDEIYSGLAKLTYDFNNSTSLKVDYQGYFGDSEEPNNPQAQTGSSSTNKVDKTNQVNQIGAELIYNPDSQYVDLSTKLYYVGTEVEEQYIEASSLNSAGDVLERAVDTIGFNLDNKSRFNGDSHSHTLSYGVEAIMDEQEGSDSSRPNRLGVPNAEANYYGAYIQDEIKFNDILNNGESELFVIPAARFDYYENEPDDSTLPEDEESQFSPKIAANLKIDNNYNLFGSYSNAFRAPTLTELYASGIHFPYGGGFFNRFDPNPNLKPEKAITYEVGAGAQFDNVLQEEDEVKARFSRYITEAEDFIDQVVNSPGGPFSSCFPVPPTGTDTGCTTVNSNVDEASLWGYEGSLQYKSNNINTLFTAAYVTGKDDTTGEYLNTIHPIVVTADLSYNFDQFDSTLGYFAKYSAEHDKVNDVDNARRSYVVHNVYASWEPEEGKFNDLRVDLGVDNILDKTYTETFANNFEAGRNFRVRLTYKF